MVDNMPQDPLTTAQAGAAQQHELYLAWIAAGFTEAQSLELLKAVVFALASRPS